ncbi:MAG: serine hydrolase [Kordiimonadaceae bacterium]|nr:serine hydrolase [Kordiimonadaceae bacterium]
MNRISNKTKVCVTALICCLFHGSLYAKDLKSSDIDDMVSEVMETFSVPGMAVGVIQNGQITHVKGYGVRSLDHGGAVDENTYFGIASNSKGFTATALALLVEEGKIDWNDPVKKFLPEFKMWDPYITDHFTIRDLLSHHTGLPLGSGDLMWWPDANYSPQEVISKMRFLKPNREFRTTYAYNNLPFIVAGAIIPSVTGQSYQEFLEKRIFDPLKMDRCTANTPIMANDPNVAEPHAVLDGKLQQIKRYLQLDTVVGGAAAAGIECSLNDLLKWEKMHLEGGGSLMKKETHNALWQVNTAIDVTDEQISRDKTHFRGYGLGYNLNDYHGVKIISHGGALVGMYSYLAMIPELDFAIAIVTNQQSGDAYTVLKTMMINFVMDIKNTETPAEVFKKSELSRLEEVKRLTDISEGSNAPLPLNSYVGTYKDDWWDDIKISKNESGLYFTSMRSPSLRGKLGHYKENTFIVRWDDRTHEADSYVMFESDKNGKIKAFTMKALSNRTDFSYDFHHVHPVKQ